LLSPSFRGVRVRRLNIKREIRSKRREKREVRTLKLRNSETLQL